MKSSALAAVGRYEILGEIGRGAMGVVYKARDPHIDRIVAIKTITVLDLEPLDQKEYRQRFEQEARTAGRLSHPGIVTIFDVGLDAETDTPYIVMEYVAGQSLSKVQESEKGRLPLGPALRLAEEVAEALHYAHSEGVIHRDIKPANILVTPEGRAKIADFGIARFNQSHLTLPGRVLGSPAFMSPEQLEGETVDRRSDLFSLGVVLYTILTGHRPFQGNSTATVCFKLMNRDPLPVSAWDLDLPLNLDELLSKALAKDPNNRFQTGSEMASALEEFLRAHEFDAEPLAQIARMIDRSPLITQQIVINAEPLTAEEVPESAEGGLYTMVSRALTVRPPETAITHSSAPQAPAEPAKTAIAPAAKKSNLAAFPTPPRRKQALDPQKFGIIVGAAAVLLLVVGGLWFRHSKAAQPAAETPVVTAPAQPPEPQAQTAEPAPDTSAPEAATEDSTPPPMATRSPKPRRQTVPFSAHTIAPTPAPQLPSHVASSKLRPAVAVPATIPAEPSEITVQKMELANLDVTIEHGFEAGQASISVDHHEVVSKELHGENKRRALLFKKTEGRESSIVTLLPGKHDIEVHVKSPDGDFDLTKAISRGFAPGSKGVLLVKCDKRKKKLELQFQ